jgi:hypothetical protein
MLTMPEISLTMAKISLIWQHTYTYTYTYTYTGFTAGRAKRARTRARTDFWNV